MKVVVFVLYLVLVLEVGQLIQSVAALFHKDFRLVHFVKITESLCFIVIYVYLLGGGTVQL